MSTVSAILRSYCAPRQVILTHRAAGADEGTALMWLFVACILFFVAKLPELARDVHLNGEEGEFFGRALPMFYGLVLLAPFMCLLVAALSHLVARIFGGQGAWLDARLALFWALLAVSPLVLLEGLVGGLFGFSLAFGLVSFIAFVLIWINGLIALEKNTKGGSEP